MNRFHTTLHRGQKHARRGHKIRKVLYQRLIRLFFNCDISLEADVDETVWFNHKGFGTVLNPKTKVGGDCHISQCNFG